MGGHQRDSATRRREAARRSNCSASWNRSVGVAGSSVPMAKGWVAGSPVIGLE